MHILALFGAAGRDGCTGRLLQEFLRAMPEDSEVQILDAYATRMQPCVGCGYCACGGVCQYDDFAPLMRSLEEADILVMATPVFFLSYPAPLKAIVDRMQLYWNKRFVQGIQQPVRRSKRGVALITAGSNDARGPKIVMKQTKMVWSLLNTTMVAKAVWMGTDQCDDGAEPLAAARDAARQVLAPAQETIVTENL